MAIRLIQIIDTKFRSLRTCNKGQSDSMCVCARARARAHTRIGRDFPITFTY
jgi:hypothetical protein